MDVSLRDRDRANLLALVLERLLRRAAGPAPTGSYRLLAGTMNARIEFSPGRAEVSTDDRPVDCTVEGSLATLGSLSLGASPVRAWWAGRLRWHGSVFRALALARLLRTA